MGDPQTLLAPNGAFTPGIPTPSGLTPNTRSEAEAAFMLNSTTQTDSAAPTTPLPHEGRDMDRSYRGARVDGADEARMAYHRPAGPLRTSSANYQQALFKAREQSSATSDLSTHTTEGEHNVTGENKVASPTSTSLPLPPPGQGVVPLRTGVGAPQAEALRKARPSGLTLGALGRQQSWSEQDMKHVYSAGLMVKPADDAGYSSGMEEKA